MRKLSTDPIRNAPGSVRKRHWLILGGTTILAAAGSLFSRCPLHEPHAGAPSGQVPASAPAQVAEPPDTSECDPPSPWAKITSPDFHLKSVPGVKSFCGNGRREKGAYPGIVRVVVDGEVYFLESREGNKLMVDECDATTLLYCASDCEADQAAQRSKAGEHRDRAKSPPTPTVTPSSDSCATYDGVETAYYSIVSGRLQSARGQIRSILTNHDISVSDSDNILVRVHITLNNGIPRVTAHASLPGGGTRVSVSGVLSNLPPGVAGRVSCDMQLPTITLGP